MGMADEAMEATGLARDAKASCEDAIKKIEKELDILNRKVGRIDGSCNVMGR